MSAFTQKKVKITGNMGIAMKLNQVFSSVAGKTPTKNPSSSESSSKSGLTATTTTHKSGKFFEDIDAKIKQEGNVMCGKVNAIIGFEISCDGAKTLSYYFDLKNKPGCVGVNDGSVKPECTISISDEDLLSILAGKLNMMTVRKR